MMRVEKVKKKKRTNNWSGVCSEGEERSGIWVSSMGGRKGFENAAFSEKEKRKIFEEGGGAREL